MTNQSFLEAQLASGKNEQNLDNQKDLPALLSPNKDRDLLV